MQTVDDGAAHYPAGGLILGSNVPYFLLATHNRSTSVPAYIHVSAHTTDVWPVVCNGASVMDRAHETLHYRSCHALVCPKQMGTEPVRVGDCVDMKNLDRVYCGLSLLADRELVGVE